LRWLDREIERSHTDLATQQFGRDRRNGIGIPGGQHFQTSGDFRARQIVHCSEYGRNAAGDGGAGIDQRDVASHRSLDRATQKRVVRTAEYNGINLAINQRGDRVRDESIDLIAIGGKLLHQLDESRGRDDKNQRFSSVSINETLKPGAAGGSWGGQYSDLPAPAHRDRGFQRRFETDNRNGEVRPQRFKCKGSSCIAGDDQELGATLDQSICDEQRTPTNLLFGTRSIGAEPAVRGIKQLLVGECFFDFDGDAETAQAGIEDPDWWCMYVHCHSLSEPARGWQQNQP